MKTSSILISTTAIILAAWAISNLKITPNKKIDQLSKISDINKDFVLFTEWALKENKMYITPEERLYRFTIFVENLRYIEQENIKGKIRGYELGLNKFTDMTNEEVTAGYRGRKIDPKTKEFYDQLPQVNIAEKFGIEQQQPPKSVDWVKAGKVTPIKDQGGCGACWAFAANGVLESSLLIAANITTDLSEQQLNDCSREFNANGCEGGFSFMAFQYINYKGTGLTTTKNYPYKARDLQCKYDPKTAFVKTLEWFKVKPGESMLALATSFAPISVGVNSTPWNAYRKGIFDPDNCSWLGMNHEVVVVGYGEENGKKYWLIKNSWGEWWGEKGYMKLIRGKHKEIGTCGIGVSPTYAAVTGIVA